MGESTFAVGRPAHSSRRERRVAVAVALAIVVIAQLVVSVGPSRAAGTGQYSQPEWWPLRGNNLVGCARNSPGPVCEGTYHPVWAIDVEAPEGQPVYASGAGLAKVSSNTTGCTGYGRSVVVEHGGAVKSLYAHLSNFSAALSASPGGVWVDQDTIIGYVGHTGSVSNCTYNHLHYEETTNGGFWGSATDPGAFKACRDSRLVSYPQEWGYSSWNGLPAHTLRAVNTGTSCTGATTIADGATIANPAGEVYRVAGGAPIYVSNWSAIGGPQSATPVTQAQFDSLRQRPADGTFVRVNAGGVYRFAGGAPIYVSNWDNVGGNPGNVVLVDEYSLEHTAASGALSHVLLQPADGTFVRASAGGVYRFAGGAPIYVSNWDTVGGNPGNVVLIDEFSLEHTAASGALSHVRLQPADGTFVRASAGGVYRFAGGAPIYVSSWANVGGNPGDVVLVDEFSLEHTTASGALSHVSYYPVDGTFLRGGPSGSAYFSVRDGVASASTPSPAAVIVDPVAIANAGGGGAWNHLRAPVDTTITNGPAPRIASPEATFSFTSSRDATFECSLDAGPYSSCSSPFTARDLVDGAHGIAVRALEASGNRDPSPATWTWVVDTTAPDTGGSGPSGWTRSTDATFELSATEAGATFECSLDAEEWVSCGPTVRLEGLDEGPHTMSVRAADDLGNTDDTPTTFDWGVDLTGPTVNLAMANPSVVTPGAPAHLQATALDVGSGVAGVCFNVTDARLGSTTTVCAATPDSAGIWSIDLRLAAGVYRVTAWGSDAVGNEGEESSEVTLLSLL